MCVPIFMAICYSKSHVDLLVAQEEKSGDLLSQLDSSSGDRECQQNILMAIHPELVIHCGNYNYSISNISHVAVVVEVILSRGLCDMHGNNCLLLHNVIHCRRTVYCKTFSFVVYRIQHMPHQIARHLSFLTDCLQISAEMKSLHDISLSPPEGHAVKPHMCRGS